LESSQKAPRAVSQKNMVMGLGTKKNCAREDQRQFISRLLSHLRVAVVRSEKLVAEDWDSSGTQEEGKRPPLETATKERLVKTEKNLCVL
jgi:hypothetical protein